MYFMEHCKYFISLLIMAGDAKLLIISINHNINKPLKLLKSASS